jgi:hypothetical protein
MKIRSTFENCPTFDKTLFDMASQDDLEQDDTRNIPYKKSLGCLMYLMVYIRPNLSYSIGILSQFLINPRHVHWSTMKRIIIYLKGTLDYQLVYKRDVMEEGKNVKCVSLIAQLGPG